LFAQAFLLSLEKSNILLKEAKMNEQSLRESAGFGLFEVSLV